MMQPTHTHSTLQYIHISVPEILLSNIQIKNSWQDYNQEWSYRLDPPHASHGEFKHEVRQFQKPYDNQQAEQISLMV
ncbi:hypothetical protein APC83_16450 [Acinetobacter baumannii]|nr:hypothetical protein APC83_16450 [Acinetobacter baumannii]